MPVFFSPGEKSLDFVQQRFGHVKPYPAEDKYYKKKDRDCSYFLPKSYITSLCGKTAS